jgi:hypothetical protein
LPRYSRLVADEQFLSRSPLPPEGTDCAVGGQKN